MQRNCIVTMRCQHVKNSKIEIRKKDDLIGSFRKSLAFDWFIMRKENEEKWKMAENGCHRKGTSQEGIKKK